MLELRRAEIIESLLFLHVGADVGVFPRESVRLLYPLYIQGFFSTIRSFDPQEQAKYGTTYVPHSPESRKIYASLPHFAGILFEKAMRGEDIFESEPLRLESHLAVGGLCQALLLLYSSIA